MAMGKDYRFRLPAIGLSVVTFPRTELSDAAAKHFASVFAPGGTPVSGGSIGLCATAAMGASLLASSTASGQQLPLKEQLVGTWMLVSWEQKKGDGTKLERYGANPKGIAFFDAGGRYIITVMRSDRANYTSSALWQGTAEENKGTADGTITYFGTYSVSDGERSIAIHIEGSSFPNWNGADQKRTVAITGDQLTLTVRPPNGDIVDVNWKRAK